MAGHPRQPKRPKLTLNADKYEDDVNMWDEFTEDELKECDVIASQVTSQVNTSVSNLPQNETGNKRTRWSMSDVEDRTVNSLKTQLQQSQLELQKLRNEKFKAEGEAKVVRAQLDEFKRKQEEEKVKQRRDELDKQREHDEECNRLKKELDKTHMELQFQKQTVLKLNMENLSRSETRRIESRSGLSPRKRLNLNDSPSKKVTSLSNFESGFQKPRKNSTTQTNLLPKRCFVKFKSRVKNDQTCTAYHILNFGKDGLLRFCSSREQNSDVTNKSSFRRKNYTISASSNYISSLVNFILTSLLQDSETPALNISSNLSDVNGIGNLLNLLESQVFSYLNVKKFEADTQCAETMLSAALHVLKIILHCDESIAKTSWSSRDENFTNSSQIFQRLSDGQLSSDCKTLTHIVSHFTTIIEQHDETKSIDVSDKNILQKIFQIFLLLAYKNCAAVFPNLQKNFYSGKIGQFLHLEKGVEIISLCQEITIVLMQETSINSENWLCSGLERDKCFLAAVSSFCQETVVTGDNLHNLELMSKGLQFSLHILLHSEGLKLLRRENADCNCNIEFIQRIIHSLWKLLTNLENYETDVRRNLLFLGTRALQTLTFYQMLGVHRRQPMSLYYMHLIEGLQVFDVNSNERNVTEELMDF